MDIRRYIDEINRASRNGNLVFFVGAGVSFLSGYPKWKDLVDAFYRELYKKEKEKEYTSDDYLRIPQVFYDILDDGDKKQYDEILESVFDVEKEPNPIHYKILTMNPVHLITTNYDNLLEKTCKQRGKYYSIISHDSDVSKADSSRYLLKVHGDFRKGFKGSNVVLKESDYVNYDQDYPLISNLMKTIMSTYTIVFIGYSLQDYNINLLLNWVKRLQGNDYKMPFFIRTSYEPIEDIDAIYFNNRGLRIIDSTSLIDSGRDEYLKRYNAVMDTLIEHRNNTGMMEDSEIIEFIYNKVHPLFVLKSLRKVDFKYIFDNEYYFNDAGLIINNSSIGQDYLERFYSIQINSTQKIEKDILNKYNAIINFFSKNNVLGMVNKVTPEIISIKNEVDNPVFVANFDKIEQAIDSKNEDIEFLYKKAFYLANMGKVEEAYKLYTKIISVTIESEKLWVYFLSQINRYHLYQIIKQTSRNYKTFGSWIDGTYFPLSQQFLEQIENELKNFDLNDLFLSMPFEFQEKYKVLNIISDNNFLDDDTVKLFELTNKVREKRSKGYVSLGFSNEDEIMIRVYETICFLYDNYLLTTSFGEFKNFVKYSMTLMFDKAEYDISHDTNDFKLLGEITQSEFFINFFDFVVIAKTFNIDELEHIERTRDIKKIVFKDCDKIEEYLLRLVFKLETHHTGDTFKMDLFFYKSLISEIKSALYFARYVSLSPNCITKLVETILFFISPIELNIGKKFLWCDSLVYKNGLPVESIQLIETFLLKEAQKRKDQNYSEISSNKYSSYYFSLLIHHYHPDYVSKSLSEYIINLNEPSKNEIDYLYKLSNILTPPSRQYLFDKKEITKISDIIDCDRAGDIKSLAEYDTFLLDYVSDRMSQINSYEKRGMSISIGEDYLVSIASWFFMGEINNEKFKEFKGIVDEYDMFIEPNTFDYSKFKPWWLKNYPEKLIKKMVENSHMREKILKILKKSLMDSKDRTYLKILLKHFI